MFVKVPCWENLETNVMKEKSKPLGIALVGCGRVSDAHLEAICRQPGVGSLEAVIDTDLGRAEASANRYGAPRVFKTLEQALALDVIEAVDVCLPNHLHADAAVASLAAGRHVLVEKPMADNAAEAERMAAAAETNARVMVIGQSRRHTKAVRYVHDNLENFGYLRSVHDSYCIRWDGPQTPWWSHRSREAGLVLSLIATHSMDFVQLVMGEDDPLRVHCEAVRHQSDWKGDDEAMIVLTYPQNRLVFVHLSYNQKPYLDRKTLLFDGCVVQVDDNLTVTVNGELVIEPDPGEVGEMARPALQFDWQFAEFVKAVRGLPNRSVRAMEGVRLMRVLDAIRQAAISGAAVDMT